MDIVTVDFETFYGKDYTLSGKINMSEYIRDDRFHIHGVGIKINGGKTRWYVGANIALALRQIDWTKSAMLAHNAPFDGFILSHHFGIVPTFYYDTLAMARGAHGHHMRHDLDTVAKAHGLPGKIKRSALADTKDKKQLTRAEERALGGYCIGDVNDTYEIFLRLKDYIPEPEMRLIDLTTRMFCDPVLLVDIDRVTEELHKEVGGKAKALLLSGASIPDLMSNQRFAELLKHAGVNPPEKISPSTGKMTYAFAKSDLDFQKLLTDPNPKVRALAEARIKVKSTIGETRAMRFLEAGKDGMKLPVLLNYAGAHTLRWSGGNKMNLQNLKRGGELRKSIKAPPGHVIVVADSSQIEARVLAWLAGQMDLLEAFRNRRDIYSEFASKLFGYKVDRKQPEHVVEGFVGKVAILGLGYSMGHIKFQNTLASGAMGMAVNLDEQKCRSIINLYRNTNTQIRELWSTMDGIIASMIVGHAGEYGPLTYNKNFIQLPNEMFLQYYGIRGDVSVIREGITAREATYLTRNGESKIYGGLLTENVVQALARCIIADQMLEISDRYRVVMMTHDEVVVIAKKRDGEKCLNFMLDVMATPPDWALDLPLAAEGGFDEVYSK